jgi:ribose 5-phosphate isomerase A
MSVVESAKQAAAIRAVNDFVLAGQVVGIGSGSTIVYAIHRLAERCREEGLSIKCVPTSFQSKILLSELGLPLSDLTLTPVLDVAIDGADEVDPELNCIKGGGGCMMQEKLVALAASKFVLIADYSKQSERLGARWHRGVPVEVLPGAYVTVSASVRALGGSPKLRMAGASKAGPVVTDNGLFILDCEFGEIENPAALHSQLKQICGVLETGLFPRVAVRAYFGREDGGVDVWEPPTPTK